MHTYLSPREYDIVLEEVMAFEGETGPAGRMAIGIYLGLLDSALEAADARCRTF
jgi:hypothetical protein